MTGRVLGDFTVREALGEGASGVVYRAEQRGLDREAVVKVLHGRRAAGAREVQRFLREAQLASRLDHPYAAHVYAFGAEPDGVLWIAMELVRGTPLAKVLAAQPGGRMPLARWVALFDRLCEVVAAAHEQGIVHRDLKPENVMVVARAGRLYPKLLDLGVARVVSDPTEETDAAGAAGAAAAGAAAAGAAEAASAASAAVPRVDVRLTQGGARVGSPAYMAPEQWRGDEVDGRADLYALGVMTYEALAGALPFGGASIAEIARAHLVAPPPPLPDDVPEAVRAAVASALAKAPGDRPATALALAEAVRAGAGMRLAADALPRLDESLRADVAWLPQPIAEAIGALEGARNPHQARDALWEVVRVAARWLGVVALAARSRVGPGPGASADAPAVVELLRALHRRELGDDEWLELVRGLARPFATARDAHPIPELIALALAEASPFAPLLALRAAEAGTTSEESLRAWLARTLPIVTPLVRALGFLTDYQLVVPRDGGAEVWMGPRRPRRAMMHVDAALAPDEPALVDFDGRPVLALAPLCAIAAPSPGAAEELFVFAGAGRARRGARLVAEPHGFERHSDAVWPWLRERVLAIEDGAAAAIEDAPYRGLAAFTTADAARYVGREAQAEAFANQLLVTPLAAVVGPSGAGKSSFVQAGVVPLLPAGWRAIVMRPGAAPMATWAARVAPELAAARASASSAAPETAVVIVDQFEELFTMGAPADERAAFAAAIAAAARTPDDRARVVITLRDDFLVRAGELPALRDRLAQGLTLLATPAPDELRRILVEPARRAGYDFDDAELPARMVRAVAARPGALALLSFTAARLWELRDRHFRRLTRAAYDAIGGVEGALAAHADATLAACTGEEQRLVRDAFRHLVTAEGTRAPLTRRELDDVLGGSPHTGAVIERLIGARLLVASESEGGDGADRIELVHEALITAWPRLVQWRTDDAEGARLRDQLRAAARQWDERGRPRGLLWRDDALDDYRRWRARWPGALPALDEGFAAASLRDAARGRRLRRTLAATAATILVAATVALALLYRASRDNARASHDRLVASYVEQGRRLLLDGDYQRALPYLSAAYDAGDDSVALRVMLRRALRLAEAPRLPGTAQAAAYAGPDRVVLAKDDGAVAIHDLRADTTTVVLAAGAGDPPAWRSSSISADGAVVASARRAEVALSIRGRRASIPVRDAQRLVVSPDGASVAIADGHTLSVWSTDDLAPSWSMPLEGRPGQLAWLGASVLVVDAAGRAHVVEAARDQVVGSGYRLAVGDTHFALITDRGVRIIADRDQPGLELNVPEARNAAFGPRDAQLAVSTATGPILLFGGEDGRPLGVLAGHTGAAIAAFRSDGRVLVTAGEDQTVRVWDVERRAELVRYAAPGASPLGLAFDASGAHVVVAGAGGAAAFPVQDPSATTVIDVGEALGTGGFVRGGGAVYTTSNDGLDTWDLAGRHLDHLATGPADGAHFDDAGGRVVVPLSDGNAAAIFDARGRVAVRVEAAAPVIAAFFDHQGASFATTATDGAVELWATSGARVGTLRGHQGAVFGGDFSPDGATIVTAGYSDKTIRLWSAASRVPLGAATADDGFYAARYDASGRHIVTANDDGRVTLWNTWPLTIERAFEHRGSVRAAAISPDDELAVGGTFGGDVSVWDVRRGVEIVRFRHADVVTSVDFAPGGRTLATSSADGRAIVWDLGAETRGPALVRELLRCHVPFALIGTQLEPTIPARCDTPR